MISAVSKGVYQKSMERQVWTEELVKEKWESNAKVNAEWARYMMGNILGYAEAREKYKQLYK